MTSDFMSTKLTSQMNQKEAASAFKQHLGAVGLINDSVRSSMQNNLVKNIDEAIGMASLIVEEKD